MICAMVVYYGEVVRLQKCLSSVLENHTCTHTPTHTRAHADMLWAHCRKCSCFNTTRPHQRSLNSTCKTVSHLPAPTRPHLAASKEYKKHTTTRLIGWKFKLIVDSLLDWRLRQSRLQDGHEGRTPPAPGAVDDDVGRVGDERSVVCVELARFVSRRGLNGPIRMMH